jgi:general secretion pathway protein G
LAQVRRIAVICSMFLSGCDSLRNTDALRRIGIHAQLESFRTGLMEYRADNGNFPTTDEGLPALVRNLGDLKSWHGPYLKRIPLDLWQSQYQYRSAANSAIVSSYGADAKPGGTGSDADIEITVP